MNRACSPALPVRGRSTADNMGALVHRSTVDPSIRGRPGRQFCPVTTGVSVAGPTLHTSGNALCADYAFSANRLAQLSAEQAQTATRAQLLALMTEESLRAKVACERWQVPYPGVVVMHSGPVSPAQQLWVDLLCCGHGAVLAGVTAATSDGLTGVQVAQ